MSKVKDVRVEVRVRNNLILSAMSRFKIGSVMELGRRMKVPRVALYQLIKMKRAARSSDGTWHPVALKLADFFYCLPEDLFSPAQQYEHLERNRGYAAVEMEHIRHLATNRQTASPEIVMQAQELRNVIRDALCALTPRQERIVRWRFGFDDGDDLTLNEIGARMGICGQRVREIEAKALRRLKHPARANQIKAVCADGGTRNWTFDHKVLEAL